MAAQTFANAPENGLVDVTISILTAMARRKPLV
jgi:hypothetical protein